MIILSSLVTPTSALMERLGTDGSSFSHALPRLARPLGTDSLSHTHTVKFSYLNTPGLLILPGAVTHTHRLSVPACRAYRVPCKGWTLRVISACVHADKNSTV